MNPLRRPKVFISRTTAGLGPLADEIAQILRDRGAEPIIQSGFLPDWRSVPQMLQDKLISCDSVIALIGPIYGAEPDPNNAPAQLKDSRTQNRPFSFTQWEYLVARDLARPLFTFLLSGPSLIAPFEKESPDLEQRQQQFINDFARDPSTLYYEYADREKLLAHIREMPLPINVSAGRPHNLPEPIGHLFKGRDEFLKTLRQKLLAGDTTVIHGRQAIHGMGGVGKTRAAIEYAWSHAEHYNALLFIAADSPEALQRNLAALCGPLVLNLPEQTARELDLQIAAVHRWLNQHPGWFLIIDNVDTPEAQKATRALCQQLPHGHILITSRLADWPTGFSALDLDVLTEADSISLLLDHTKGRRTEHLDDQTNAAKIAQNLDGLALALEQAAAWVRKDRRTFADYLAEWEKTSAQIYKNYHERGLDDYHKDHPELPRPLLITYTTSINQLTPEAHQLFQILSWIAPDPMPVQHIENLKSLPNPRQHLIELADLHLIRLTPDTTTCTIHRLLQEITRQQQTEPKPPSLLTALHWINGEFRGDPDDVRSWPLLRLLNSHTINAAFHGANRGIAEPSGRMLNSAGLLLSSQGDFNGAEVVYRASLSNVKKSRVVDDQVLSTCLNNLGNLLATTNRFAEAEPLLRHALAIDEKNLGLHHPEVAVKLNNLAQLLADTDRTIEAEALFRRALAIDEKTYGAGHTKVATRLNNLSNLLLITNHPAEAEPLLRRAVFIDEKNFGPDHPNVATILNNLANLLFGTNRVAEAESLYRRVLKIDETIYGPDHPAVSRDLNNLAQTLEETNRFAEAEPLMRRALAIDEKIFGPSHPEVAIRLSNLAQLLQATNSPDAAEPLMRRALEIDEASFGTDHPKVAIDLNNLAYFLHVTNRSSEAEPLMRSALKIYEKALGPDHPDVAIGLNNLGGFLMSAHRIAEAEPLTRRALEILLKFTRNSNHRHPRLGVTLNNYFEILLRLGHPQDLAGYRITAMLKQYGVSYP
jgi:tetratricopeptide (TPR) repeat protein